MYTVASMNVMYTLQDIIFEWDSQKADENLRKHGVSFELACEAFFDPFSLWLDDELVEGELRETIIGMTVNWRPLYVVYVMRDDSIRIISARRVTGVESRHYEDQ